MLNVPIYDAVKKYVHSDPCVFHMPGHKLGKGIPGRFLEDMVSLDVTEIPGTDNLHAPEGAIAEAQELAARAFGSDHTFFLVNGSTCGIHAMIMTVCKPGQKLIVARDCHKAVINGMMLAGVTPVFIKPRFDSLFGISTAVTPEEVGHALDMHPDARGVFVTRPNYYGICSDIEAIAAVTHRHGKILMVDEAHGAHLRFSPELPDCAMDSGADMCVQSAHKTLPALTQGAYLQVKSKNIDMDRLKFNLSLIQTSSPSYILMAYLDIARAIMEDEGRNKIKGLLEQIAKFEKELQGIAGLAVLNGNNREFRHDGTRLVIRVSDLGLTGFDAEEVLRREYGIQVEMSDLKNIVCITTIADRAQDLERLLRGLRGLAAGFKRRSSSADNGIREIPSLERGIEMGEALHADGEWIEIIRGAGRISLQMITPYPPGIPVICPGEIITEEILEYIYTIKKLGGNITGLDGEIRVLKK